MQNHKGASTLRSFFILGFLVTLTSPGLLAQRPASNQKPRTAKALVAAPPPIPGCEYKEIDPQKYGEQPFQNPPAISSAGGILTTTLAVQYTDSSTTSLGGCPLTLRTYNGQLVGPALRAKAGDVMDVLLSNQLPIETLDEIERQFQQENSNAYISTRPASFNTTNLHTHGLHVSPVGNSDNVLLELGPQTTFPFEIKLPKNHPSGTFWYHAHTHGSTAIQVGSGMAGALIVEDDPKATPPALLAANKDDKIFVIQSILYDTQGRLDDITKLFPGPSNPTPANCAKDGNDGTWPCAKRRTTINGQIIPVITMHPGEVQRWRLIDSSFRETIGFSVEGHELHEIALDGIYLGHIDTWPAGVPIDLEPGYRSDVLIKASSKVGTYRILDAAAPPSRSLRAVAQPESLLAILKVEGPAVTMSLPTDAEMAPLAPFGNADLSKTAVGVEDAVFKLGQDMPGDKNYFQINYSAFNPHKKRQLILNTTEQWTLTTVGDPADVANGIPPLPHVFHIHVNPFQFTRKNPSGANEIVWKDTLLIPAGQVLNIFTKYTDYVGDFVMHCHILDHEDLGMMEMEEIVDPSQAIQTHEH
jgi:FtsP/CotA-like multicopper oxidase with cupredoxin domain